MSARESLSGREDFAQICAVMGAAAKMTATVRMQASFYCNARHYFLFFLDMAVIFKVYLKGLDKSWETRSWSQKSREGKKKRKSFPDAGLLGIPSPSISVFVSLMLAGLWNILLWVFNTGLCLSLPQKASSEPELGTATHSHPPPTRHHHHHPTSWLNIKQLHLTFY